MRRCLAAACAVLVACGAPRAEAPAPSRPPLPTPPAHIEVQGHRGARAVLPEESIAAFTRALEVGVDTLELDVSMTKDDRLVVLHDLRINDALCLDADGKRPTSRPAVRSLTLAEIETFDCGTLKNERFPKQTPVPGARIATLAEVFELGAGKNVGFNVEMKSVPAHPELTPAPDVFARAILDEASRHHVLDRMTIQSFDHRMLAAVKRIAPRTPISLLVEGTLPDLVALAENAQAEVVSPNVDWITAPDVRALHARGVRVIPWTANTPEEWSYLVGIGVDGIISDDPAALVEWLRQRRLR